jgi:uncharacterized protein YjiS (DUF1127 family)
MLLSHRCDAQYAPLLSIFKSLSEIEHQLGGANAAPQDKDHLMLSHLMLRAWRRCDMSLRELSSLGDRELADIGVARSDIQQIAWETARR